MSFTAYRRFSPAQSFLAGSYFALAMAIFLMLASPFNAAAAAETQTPEAFVENVADQVLAIVTDKSLSLNEKKTKFLSVFDKDADVNKVAIFALGQYARLPTPEQREEYLALVRKFVAEVYVRRLTEYTSPGVTLDVSGHTSKGKNIIVQSKLTEVGQEPVAVEWWLLSDGDNGYKVFDLNVAGIWLAQEQRAQFTSLISNNGGKFQALLDHLNKQIKLADD